MKEKTRQRFLRELGYRRLARKVCTGGFRPAQVLLSVYIPEAVREAHPGTEPGDHAPYARTVESAQKLGAKNIRVQDGQLVADWPQKYWE
jgi:hypothetical protein